MLLRLEQGALALKCLIPICSLASNSGFERHDAYPGAGHRLALTQQRVRGQILGPVARHAAVMRWCMLLASVAYVLTLVLWHYAVIDELRRALTFYLAQ